MPYADCNYGVAGTSAVASFAWAVAFSADFVAMVMKFGSVGTRSIQKSKVCTLYSSFAFVSQAW
jgi:hypothetical protein